MPGEKTAKSTIMKWTAVIPILGLFALACTVTQAAPAPTHTTHPDSRADLSNYDDAVEETLLSAVKAAIMKTGNNFSGEEYEAMINRVLVSATRALLLKAESLDRGADSAERRHLPKEKSLGDEIEDIINRDAKMAARSMPPPFSRWTGKK
ncbi:uncharacterized protein LOC135486207 [Lineus longissimus]|uniref:uncharacterized protein LOC135486207 n=1 Tax=Lineus longissimus TaxID=88925 RepID=UPI002B4EEBD1